MPRSMFDWLRRRERGKPRFETNEAWLEALQGGPQQEAALTELRSILVRGLRAVLRRRVPREADAMAEDVAQEALLRVLDRLDSFRGESKFTTWAQKVAVRIALGRLRRKRWENISLEDLKPEDAGDFTPAALTDAEPGPEEQTSQAMLLARVEEVIQEDLTERQRTAITAVMLHGMPMDEVARRLETNRNALYKLIYDARQRLRKGLEARGLSAEELLAELDEG